MTAVLICRTAEEDCLLGNVALARLLRAAGESVALVFTGEALHSLGSGSLRWSREFATRRMQSRIIKAAESQGIPMADPARDARWSDVRQLVETCSAEDGVRAIACPVWSQLLADPNAPAYLETIAADDYAKLLGEAATVVGAY